MLQAIFIFLSLFSTHNVNALNQKADSVWFILLSSLTRPEQCVLPPVLTLDYSNERDRANAVNLLARPDTFTLLELENFLTPEDCERLIDYAVIKGLERSKTSGGVSEYRTSQQVWIEKDDLHDEAILEIHEKIQSQALLLTGRLTYNGLESLQVARYRKGEQFKEHRDGYGREFTLNIYLNDDLDGGHTAFPNLGRSFRPKAGKVAVWRNFDSRSKVFDEALHQGEPVLNREKFICTQWVKRPRI